MRRDRHRHQRGAEAGEAEDHRAGESGRSEHRDLGGIERHQLPAGTMRNASLLQSFMVRSLST